MKNLLIIILSVFLLTSCVTQRRCNEKFPPQVSIKDSSVRIVLIKTRIDTVRLPGDRVKIIDHAYCDSLNRAQLPLTTVKSNKGLKASVEIKNGKVDVECYYDSLMSIIKHQDSIISTNNFHSKVEVRTVTLTTRHWYDKIFTPIGIFSILLLAIYLFIKFK